ncbi:subtilisin-like serine protease QhpE [Motiliproteus sp.]|uniref:subtilisin-like serine protease QhpE n=1 Tax=Motiliproteus sp. TaxID=1898955 RepID=UPI003BAC4D19
MSERFASRVRVGLVDSGVAEFQRNSVAAMADFSQPQGLITWEMEGLDRLGHGSTLAGVMIQQLPEVALLSAKIFDRRLAANAEQAAKAIDWLLDQGVQVINLSFGIRTSRPALEQACIRAGEAGVVLVASSPAMGAEVFPAAYSGVIRVTGDARCAPGETSWGPSAQADFGACVRPDRANRCHPNVVGASVAAAYISAQVGCYLQSMDAARNGMPDPVALRRWLSDRARYRTEQRSVERIPWSRRLTWAV